MHNSINLILGSFIGASINDAIADRLADGMP